MAISGVISIDLDIHDANGNDLVAPPIITDTDDYDEFTVQHMEIASADTFVDIAFGPVTTANLILIQSDQELTVKFDGGATILVPCKEFLLVKSVTGNTALAIKNFSGSAAIVKVHILGT